MAQSQRRMSDMKIEIIDGAKCYVLPEHSYVSYLYQQEKDGVYYNHTYIRLPVKGSTTVYEDLKVTHVHMRDDVHVCTYPDGSVQVSFRHGDPFINIYQYRAEQRRKEKEIFLELLQEKGRSIDSSKISVQFKDGKIEIKHLDSGRIETFFGAYSAYNYVAKNVLYCTTQP